MPFNPNCNYSNTVKYSFVLHLAFALFLSYFSIAILHLPVMTDCIEIFVLPATVVLENSKEMLTLPELKNMNAPSP